MTRIIETIKTTTAVTIAVATVLLALLLSSSSSPRSLPLPTTPPPPTHPSPPSPTTTKSLPLLLHKSDCKASKDEEGFTVSDCSQVWAQEMFTNDEMRKSQEEARCGAQKEMPPNGCAKKTL